MTKKLRLYFHTLRYLKSTQIRYRIFYALRLKWRKQTQFRPSVVELPKTYQSLQFMPSLPAGKQVVYQRNQFTFLNQTCSFEDNINWNESKYGKLWTYNLTYFEFLLLPNFPKSEGLRLIRDFIGQIENIQDGVEPFPVALRIMNWIKFLVEHKTKDTQIDHSLYQQLHRLLDHLEYHLLGNHLLENGFALLFGAYYFQSKKFYDEAKKILLPELKEQILSDGVHFELSPMYHQWMLYRVLDSYNLAINNHFFRDDFVQFLRQKAALMLGALQQLTFSNGNIALLNDSAFDIAPTTRQLSNYAKQLDVKSASTSLKASGYRRINHGRYELLIDVGNIGPSYIPGHAHSDTFSFILYVDGQAFITDTGISTYEANAIRQSERSTAAHNTVQVNGKEQSEIWSAFRVARRANITQLEEGKNWIAATHNGYRNMGVLHTRKFEWSENEIVISDHLTSSRKHSATAYLHFMPDISLRVSAQKIESQMGNITFAGESTEACQRKSYSFAPTFYRTIEANYVSIDFHRQLETRILL